MWRSSYPFFFISQLRIFLSGRQVLWLYLHLIVNPSFKNFILQSSKLKICIFLISLSNLLHKKSPFPENKRPLNSKTIHPKASVYARYWSSSPRAILVLFSLWNFENILLQTGLGPRKTSLNPQRGVASARWKLFIQTISGLNRMDTTSLFVE